MFIANELRKTNIAEYLLYMWQVEDTIRAFDCSISRIRREYIDRFDYTDEQKEDEADWFGNLIRMMNQEGSREQGHLQINKVTMQTLSELHSQLLSSPKFPFYNAEYYKVLPFIVELRNHGANKEETMHSMEPCCSVCRRRRLLPIHRLLSRRLLPLSAYSLIITRKIRKKD